MATRTAAQNRTMHGLVNQAVAAGRTREEGDALLAACCRAASGQDRSSLLSEGQAGAVISALRAELEKHQPRAPWGPRGPGPRSDTTITPQQQQMLASALELAGFDTTEKRAAFSRRQCGHPWPQSQADFDAIVEASKAIITRALDRDDLRGRLTTIATHPQATDWERAWAADVGPRVRKSKTAMSPGRLSKLLEIEARLHV